MLVRICCFSTVDLNHLIASKTKPVYIRFVTDTIFPFECQCLKSITYLYPTVSIQVSILIAKKIANREQMPPKPLPERKEIEVCRVE